MAVIAVQLLAPGTWSRWPWAPLAVGLLAGLPHGALDHLVPWWSAATGSWTRRRIARTTMLMAAYAALAVLVFLLARLWATPALLVLLLASVVHFGTGESSVGDLRVGARGPAGRWIGPGTAMVLGPFVFWPATVRPVLEIVAPGSAAVLLGSTVLRVGAVVVALAVLTSAVACARGRRWGELAELALLVAVVLLVPPLAAFGVYFGAWHGLRHLARLVDLDPANQEDLRSGRLLRPWLRIAAAAALPTGAVLVVFVVLLLTPGMVPGLLGAAVSTGLSVVLALTVPHMIVVAGLDRRRRAEQPRPRTQARSDTTSGRSRR
ncbi:beta-carotene 15,15'-dioxygenase, Brp/Blh family [Actinomycetospora sp. CA-084318]|uniref:beta-carotene 15,15'-dioxygenase, Brp/Blh family n=1 Tax=Actinomycetospora sp. CA-084318 TaxID=3239892 RepID=UPI003D98B993